mmetsp:Transcript_123425/g.308401  ORF Transcript_123425/g.308401 Transcript_123425/m.308401 type:complete len:251 (-) Transcript_123425:361-1113(-)
MPILGLDLRSCFFCLTATHLWSLDLLRWRRELSADAVYEDSRPPIIWHCRVHDGTVTVALDVSRQTLIWFRPANGASAVALYIPCRESIEGSPQSWHNGRRNEVYEGIAEGLACAEVDGDVDHVKQACEAHLIERLQQRVSRQQGGQASKHDCSARLTHLRRCGLRAGLCIRQGIRARCRRCGLRLPHARVRPASYLRATILHRVCKRHKHIQLLGHRVLLCWVVWPSSRRQQPLLAGDATLNAWFHAWA